MAGPDPRFLIDPFEPAYLSLSPAELQRRVEAALQELEDCCACPRNCHVNRMAGETKTCFTGRHARVASAFPHRGEENCLRGWRGSGTVFFGLCNLRCVFCFPPDTLIATPDGPARIADLFDAAAAERRVGSGVARRGGRTTFGRGGAPVRVSQVFKHPFDGELVEVKATNCPPVRMTPSHRMFVASKEAPNERRLVAAGELSEGDYLVVPRRPCGTAEQSIDVACELRRGALPRRRRPAHRVEPGRLLEALQSRRTSLAVGAELGYHPAYVRTLRSRMRRGILHFGETEEVSLVTDGRSVRFRGEHVPGIPARVQVSEAVAWLLGLYCAEGHVGSYKDRPNAARLVISFGHHEQAALERAQSTLESVFGVSVRAVPRRTTNTIEVYKTSLARLFKHLCGDRARSKRVPGVIARSPESVVRAFLDGYLAGDGTETERHRVANTVSHSLAMGLFDLGLRLKLLPSYHAWRPPPTKQIEGRRVRQSTLYHVKFKRDRLEGKHDPRRERSRWRDAGTHFLVPIRSIKSVSYRGPVYNLEVDDPDRSYVAPFIAVSNCQNWDISQQPAGEAMDAARLAAVMLALQGQGCHNINFVTPEHVVPQVIEAVALAVAGGLRLPIVYNTSAYDSVDSLRLLDGVVDLYMPDFKFWEPATAKRLAKAADYPAAARAAIAEMHRQVGPLRFGPDGLARRGVLVRHLVMPGQEAEAAAIFGWLARECSPDTYVNIMGQWRPEHLVGRLDRRGTVQYPEINRRLNGELAAAHAAARAAGLWRFDERAG